MRVLKLLFIFIFMGTFLSSCVVNEVVEVDRNSFYEEEVADILLDFSIWERIESIEGDHIDFGKENFLQFRSGSRRTFRSSLSNFLSDIVWDFNGNYKVSRDIDNRDAARLTLFYNDDNGSTDYFIVHIINDDTITLEHIDSGNKYTFRGR